MYGLILSIMVVLKRYFTVARLQIGIIDGILLVNYCSL